jgi:hypothetical protein
VVLVIVSAWPDCGEVVTAGDGPAKITVQTALRPALNCAGLQAADFMGGIPTVMFAVREMPLRFAETVVVVYGGFNVLAVKTAELLPAVTETVAGTVRLLLLL